MTNFDRFLTDPQFTSFAEAAAAAEKILQIDVAACILNCRRAMECGVKWMYSVDGALVKPWQDTLVNLMNAKEFRDIVGKDLWKRMDHIRRMGNAAAHTGKALTRPQAELSGGEMTEIIELFQALERNKNDGSFGSDMRQMIALLNLLIRLAPILNMASAGESIHNKDFLRVSPILDYIRDNLAEPLTLDQIAGQFYISKHYLCRIFKAATGFSVMEYIIYSRVLRARQLLQEGVSVQQAGELSGFSDNSHFIRTFGHLTGLTPGKYAKEYQSGDQVLL